MIPSVASYSAMFPNRTMKQHQFKAGTSLPDKILLAYTYNNCQDLSQMDKVTQAIKDGVNVLIWVFLSFEPVQENVGTSNTTFTERIAIKSPQNKENLILYQNYLNELGYAHVVHLAAFGGWNGPHLPSGYTAAQLYQSFQQYNEYHTPSEGIHKHRKRLFDGIDWDLEGHDVLQCATNEFTLECLIQIGEFSELAKTDGLIVSMAPPESYLDISSQRFSRFVNHTYPEDEWHQDFQYHGWNVYSYLLARYSHVFHLIFLQFYESYSHAAYHIKHLGQTPYEYLIDYMTLFEHHARNNSWYINFEDDPSVLTKSQIVPLDPNKLVLGFANGWALNNGIDDEKTIFFSGNDVCVALQTMARDKKAVPRGLGFWVIDEEGTNGVDFAKDLFHALHPHHGTEYTIMSKS